jgi:cytochrome b561
MLNKYPVSMRVFHWLMALLIVTLLCVGLWMSGLEKDNPDRAFFYSLHKSFGVMALIFIFLRTINRLKSSVPKLPDQISRFESALSGFIHFTLYLVMFLMPISGYLMSDFGGQDVYFFSYLMPDLFHTNRLIATGFWIAHKYLAYTLIGAVILHLLGTIIHYFKDNVNLFNRMW